MLYLNYVLSNLSLLVKFRTEGVKALLSSVKRQSAIRPSLSEPVRHSRRFTITSLVNLALDYSQYLAAQLHLLGFAQVVALKYPVVATRIIYTATVSYPSGIDLIRNKY